MSALIVVLGTSGLDAGTGTQVAVLTGLVCFVLAAVTFLWSRIEGGVLRDRGSEVSIQEQMDAVEVERTLTRWAARLAAVGGVCWSAAMVLFMLWLSA